jgi:D-aspartate ligase
VKSILKTIRSELSSAILLLKLGGLKVFLKQCVRHIYSKSRQIRLELDIIDIPKVESTLKYHLHPASDEDIREVIEKSKTESKDMIQKLLYRRGLYEDGYRNCYIARTTEANELCMLAFIIYPEDHKIASGRFRNSLPSLMENEVYLAGAYTFEKFRGNNIHSAVIADRLRICKEKGFKRVITYVERGNKASLKGIENAGFKPTGETLESRYMFFTRRKFYPRKIGAVVIDGHYQGLGILRSLGRQNIPTYLLDTGMCIARISRYTNRFSKCPDVKNHSLFLEYMKDLAIKKNIKEWLIYPNDDETVYFLSKYKEQLEEYYRVTTPSWDIIKYAYDKALTYQLAEQHGIAIPRTYYPRNIEELSQLEVEYPVIIKPSIKVPFYNVTKKKAVMVKSKEELFSEFRKAIEIIDPSQTLLVQQLIPGRSKNLFSVGSLSKNGEILARVVVQRLRQHPMDFGHSTTYAKTVDLPELEENASKILAAMGYSGLSEVEFIQDPKDGQYKLLEINARPWGWHTIAIGAGVDLPYLSYQDMLGEKIVTGNLSKETKWFHLITDIPTAFTELFRGRMKLKEYLVSFKGKKEFAVFSLKDPLPFIMELVLLPYLWLKRGF